MKNDPFIAAVRSQLYESCHPLMTQHLAIEPVSLGPDAGLVGAGQFALQRGLAASLQELSAPIPQSTTRSRSVRV